jgi:protein-tyrosine phosphatase
MVDLHTHILPGLDDGAQTMEDSLEMLSLAARSGGRHLVASSHGNYYNYSLEDYKTAFSALQTEILRQQIPVKIYPAMEIFMDRSAMKRILAGALLSINHTSYLLVEFSFDEQASFVAESLLELKRHGYRPVLAHPERYFFMQQEPSLAYFLEEQEIVLQVNAGSLLGDLGRGAQKLSNQFLKDGIVRVIASDAHDCKYRPPSLKRVYSYLNKLYTPFELRLWFSENPSRILKGYPTLGTRKEE